jgi:hypothetical protein
MTSYKRSSSSPDHPEPPSAKAALYGLLKRRNYLDVWFLAGQASDLGVSVPAKPPPVLQSVVVRILGLFGRSVAYRGSIYIESV